MSCPNNDCSGAPVAGAGQFTVNVPQRTCSGATFCNAQLEGLPFAGQVDLVGVPEGDQCLHRINAPVGVWHHDPNRPGGADYVAPLNVLGTALSTTECGFQPSLRLNADGSISLVKQDVDERPDGELAVINTCASGTQRTDILDPEDFDNDNPCEVNLSLLGWVNQAVIINGQNALRKVWKQVTRLLFPSTQLTSFTGVDYTDGAAWRRATWKKVGECWELGYDEADPAVSDSCADLISTGSTFPYLLACKDGITKKVEPTAGMSPVGDGTNFQMVEAGGHLMDDPIYFVGQVRGGNTNTPSISGMTDVPAATSGQTSGSFDMTAIPGYTVGSKKAKLRIVTMVDSLIGGGEALAKATVNNMTVAQAYVDSAYGFGYSHIDYVEVKLTADGFTFTLTGYSLNTNTQAYVKLEVYGWT